MGTPYKDKLPGGLGDEKVPSDFDQEQLKKGVQVELEHGKDDPLQALEIAIDHLTEDPQYYDLLEKIEGPGANDSEGGRGLGPGKGDPSKCPFRMALSEGKQEKRRIRERIIDFLTENPEPDDTQVHQLAESLGIDHDDLEEEIYDLLSDLLKNKGVSRKGKDRTNFIEGDEYRRLLAEIVLSLYGRSESALAEAAVRLFMRRR